MFVGSAFQLGFLPPKTYFFIGNLTLNSCYAEIKSNLTWLALYFDTDESKTGLVLYSIDRSLNNS